MKNCLNILLVLTISVTHLFVGSSSFSQVQLSTRTVVQSTTPWQIGARKDPKKKAPGKVIGDARRKQLGIPDGGDEYDLDVALATNTDDFISKVVAGSLILAILALLVAGIIIPATADLGDDVCKPLLTGGRC